MSTGSLPPLGNEENFLPGLTLARHFYDDVIQPIMAEQLSQLDYAAAFMGPGSEVLGFDDPRSTDHDWGARLQLFLPTENPALRNTVNRMLHEHLPPQFLGFPVFFKRSVHSGSAAPAGKRLESFHLVELHTISGWFEKHLGCDPVDGLSAEQWLSIPEQKLLEMTSGEIYHDPHEALSQRRDHLSYLPEDFWIYRLASSWQQLAEIESFVGRCNEIGDPVGMRVLAADIVRLSGDLFLLMNRQYRPYAKWWGRVLQHTIAESEYKLLLSVLEAEDYHSLEIRLGVLYRLLADTHNELGLTPQIAAQLKNFYDRPYRVLFAARFASALQQAISDSKLRSLPLLGSINELSHNVVLHNRNDSLGRLQALWELRKAPSSEKS